VFVVLKDRAVLLYKIERGLPFNLGDLIFHHVACHAELSSQNTSLMPYPCFISKYLHACPCYTQVNIDKIVRDLKVLRPPHNKTPMGKMTIAMQTLQGSL
jgi:hypothetical protein